MSLRTESGTPRLINDAAIMSHGDPALAARRRIMKNGRRPQRRAGVWPTGVHIVEHVIQLHIEKLPEGVYLATSDDVQGLVAQGRTIQEALEIARDVAKKLIEAQSSAGTTLQPAGEAFDYPLIVAV